MKNYNLQIPEEELQLLIKVYRSCKNKKNSYRINVIILLAKGYTYQQIVEVFLINERHIRRIRDIYLEKGIDGLLYKKHKGGKSNLTDAQLAELNLHIENNLYSSSVEICDYVEKKYKVKYSPETMVQLLRRLGFSYKKTKIVPGKADKEKQEEFVKNYREERKNLKKTEKTYFLDAVHPTHNVMPAFAWIKKGIEKEVKSNSGRDRVNINGVYSPIDHEIIVISADTINTQATIRLFKKILKLHPELTRIIVYGDRAKYYTSKLLKEYLENTIIEFKHLPTYSPNLNLIERLWKLLKKKTVYNKYYENFDLFKKAIMNFFRNKSIKRINEIKSLLTENFHIYATC